MITNFKLFEKEGDKFKIGDWVLLEEQPDGNGSLFNWNVYRYVKILDNNSAKNHYNPYNEDDYEEPQNDYKIETFDLKTNELKKFWVDAVEIDRKLTPEEIEETKAILLAKKYNII